MYGGPNQFKQSQKMAPLSPMESNSFTQDINHQTGSGGVQCSFSLLLELAADNDVEGFKRSVFDESEVKAVGLWYGRRGMSKKMVLEQRTPLMIAAEYGSVDIVKLIVSLPDVDVNFSCGLDKSTALHCAVSGGSANTIDVVKLLLLAGADRNATDANGCRPVDLIVSPPNFPDMKITLEELLKNDGFVCSWDMQVSSASFRSSSPALSSTTDDGSLSSFSGSSLSPAARKPNDVSVSPAKKEYPVDPTLPDIKSSVYASDEFRMFSFKIRPCSRAYSHDWTECPFVHPGENARRRDPRKYQYSCAPCPDYRKGTCRRGDLCEYAHGIFECWLHPAQYKTRLCKDGTNCLRRVCFFAHRSEELRPFNVSIGAANLISPNAHIDFAATSNLLPRSPSAVSVVSPLAFTSPKQPSGNNSHSSVPWPQQNIPNLSNNLQASRLRNYLNARDISPRELNGLQDFGFQQLQLLNDLSRLYQPSHSASSTNLSTLNPSNIDKLYSEYLSSPQQANQTIRETALALSPTYKSASPNEFQQHQQSMLSPMQRMSHCIKEPMSPESFQLSFIHREKLLQQLQNSLMSQKLGSKPSHDLGSNGMNSWLLWESGNGNVDSSVQADELGRSHTSSCSIEDDGEEPDVSWVHSVLKESPSETKETTDIPVSGIHEGYVSNLHNESSNHVALRACREGLQLDQPVA